MLKSFEVDESREFCNCGSLMNCKSRFEHRRDDDRTSDYSIEIFKIFKCLTCFELTLLLYSADGNEEQDEWNPYIRPNFNGSVLDHHPYTRKVLISPPKKLHKTIPNAIAEVADQARLVLTSSPRASFILCRALLEEICNDFKIPTVNVNSKNKSYFISLQERLTCLFKQEKVEKDLIEIIQGIKELGNEGAHSEHLIFTERFQNKDTDSLLRIVDYVMERVYTDRYRKEQAKQELAELKAKIIDLE